MSIEKNLLATPNANGISVGGIIVIIILSILVIIGIVLLIVTLVKQFKKCNTTHLDSLNNEQVTQSNFNYQPEQNNLQNYETEPPPYYPAPAQARNSHGIIRLIFIVAVIITLIFGILKTVSCITTPNNTDNDLNPFNRLANNSDITITQSDTPFSYQFKLVAHEDISELEVTISFSDSQKVFTSQTEYVGSIKKNQTYNFSISKFESTTSPVYWNCEVTSGTVSLL